MEDCLNDIIARNWIDLYTYRNDPLRVYFVLVESPYWLYLDHCIRKYNVPELKESEFCLAILKKCEFLEQHIQKFEETFGEFLKYRRLVPTYGAVLLNQELDKVVLATNYKYGNKGFPKGKLNEGETEVQCAIREVYEEVGVDITNLINEKEYIFIEGVDEKYLKLFIIPGIDESTKMEPKVPFEIEDIRFYSLSELEINCKRKDKPLKQVQQLIGLIIKWVNKKKKSGIFVHCKS